MREVHLKRLGISLEDLYAEKKQIRAHVKSERGQEYEFSIILVGRDKQPDCKVSSWGANLWFRTTQGQNRKQYVAIQGLEKAVKNVIKNYFSGAEIEFTLSDEIDII